ncbi:hypothetical protein [Mycobacterium phage Maco6]|nr:hypothetical protein [Mycobacterium phage Maco7]UNY41926.1 hypothetical protein [Mycobacterium phage Maco6]
MPSWQGCPTTTGHSLPPWNGKSRVTARSTAFCVHTTRAISG